VAPKTVPSATVTPFGPLSLELYLLVHRNAALCQGPYEESVRYRDFMGWDMPWYSVDDSAEP
jgi:hypothetical protein